MSRLALVAAILCAAAPLASQQATPAVDPASIVADTDLFVPLHTAPAGGAFEYGIWAGARTWKASFHDGFVFHPRPGQGQPDAMPFRYRLERVSVGSETLFPATVVPTVASPEWNADRCEYRHAGVVEAYDVSRDGVEQSFRIDARPAARGDLVVRGAIDTPLVAAPQDARHGALLFRDAAGDAVVRYGEAFAFDAGGDRIAVGTRWDGACVELVVPAEWLDRATFPVTVDPLTTRVVLFHQSFFFDRYHETRLERDSATGQLMLLFSYSFGTSDLDFYAHVLDANFANPQLVYTDIGSPISYAGDVAFVGGSAKWAIAHVRQAPNAPFTTTIHVYLHDSGNTTQNSGTLLSISPGANERLSFPDIGGSDGARALLVYELETIAPATSEVVSRLVNVATATLGAPTPLDPVAAGTTFQREMPSVTSTSNTSGGSWIAAWHQRDTTIANDDFDLRISRIGPGGNTVAAADIGPDSGGPTNKVRAQVDGTNARYLVAWQQQNTTASGGSALELGVQRFDWAENSSTPVNKQIRLLASDPNATLLLGEVATDTLTDSHWGVVWTTAVGGSAVVVNRLGYTGGTVETQVIPAQPTTGLGANYSGPSITFDPANRRFPFARAWQEVYISGLTAAQIHAQHLTYPPDATNRTYGIGCGGTISAPEPPYTGHEFYSVVLSGALPNVLAVFEISLLPANIDLTFIGMPRCFQLVEPGAHAFIVGITGTTDARGSMRVTFPVQDVPAFQGTLYFLYAHVAPRANPLGLLGTQGLEARYR